MPDIDGKTRLIAHVGDPTVSFKAPMIYNPYFESIGVNAAVVPMGVTAPDFGSAFPAIMRFTNVDGALITMPHKVAVMDLLAEASPSAKIAMACNAVKRRADGALTGDMFDGDGFVRGLKRKGRRVAGESALVMGAGGVGSAIAASLAAAGIGRIVLHDIKQVQAEALAGRLAQHYPGIAVTVGGNNDTAGHDILVNGTPLGMREGDPLPFDVTKAKTTAIVGEVVMAAEMTPLLRTAQARGLAIQAGVDMLFEQIPAYLGFFGFPVATPERLRSLAKLYY
jgi:shikimate dehydrogenase